MPPIPQETFRCNAFEALHWDGNAKIFLLRHEEMSEDPTL